MISYMDFLLEQQELLSLVIRPRTSEQQELAGALMAV